jgi:hypothetical protein
MHNSREYPFYVITSDIESFYKDAQDAAQAFFSGVKRPNQTQVMVMTSPGMGYEVAGVNVRGDTYLNLMDFQSSQMTKDFQAAYHLGPTEPVVEAPAIAEPQVAARVLPAPVLAAPEVPKPAASEYFSLHGDSTQYYDAHDAAMAFHKGPKTPNTSVSVMKGVGYGHEVAGVNSRGEAFLNALEFQGHEMTKAFQTAYQDILAKEARLNGPWYEVSGDPTKYFDAQEAAKAFQASEKTPHSTVMVMSGPGYGFEAAGVNNEGETYLNQKDFQSHPMQLAFKEAYGEILTNEQANTPPSAGPTVIDVIELTQSDSLRTSMDPELMKKLFGKPPVKEYEASQLIH